MKVANAIAAFLSADIINLEESAIPDLSNYDMVGFGSGIDSGIHSKLVLDLADHLQAVSGKRAFIFSTNSMTGKDKVADDHRKLRDKLVSKGYRIAGEFACRGFNTNSFLRYIGGINRNRPNAEDFRKAEEFACKLKQNFSAGKD